jgi:hypothetical protein
MNVTLVLGEYARAAEGRLDVLGAGWVTTGSPASFGIGILFEAQPGEFGGKHTIVLELVDEDGQPVPIPDSDQPLVRVEGEIEVIPPPGHLPALPIVVPVAFNAANAPLPTGRRLEFRLWLDGETSEEWALAFSTQPQ